MRIIYLLATFSTSFATMSYAMILSSIISDLTGEEIYSQCLTMGPYLLGLGLGSVFGDKVKLQKTLKTLWSIEWLSMVILPLIPLILMFLIFLYLHLSPLGTSLESRQSVKIILAVTGIFSFVTGLLGGAQLPLIIRLAQDKLKVETVLATNYLGPLMSGPFVVYCNGLTLPVSFQIGATALIQVAGLTGLIYLEVDRKLKLLLLSLPLLLILVINRVYPSLEFSTIKSSYLGTKMSRLSFDEFKHTLRLIDSFGEFERVKTPYQVIDFLTLPPVPELQSPSNSTLYLNRKTQFDLYAVRPYHESMTMAAHNLLQSDPKSILILGAGDGLLLHEIKKKFKSSEVTMVELDGGMIEWSEANPIISHLNEQIFEKKDPLTSIVVGDAVTYLRGPQGSKKFDLILIDFPFPNGYELSKLYSVEFYSLVKKVISPSGLMIIDLPLQRDDEGNLSHEAKVILKTLYQTGFKNQLPFGPVVSFVALKLEGESLHFDYENFTDEMSMSTRLNMVRTVNEDEMPGLDPHIHQNSMFWPRGL